jgi:hypothetical protein
MNWLIAICQVILLSYLQVLFFVGNVTLLTYTHNCFCSSVKFGYAGVAVCVYGIACVTGLFIIYVYFVGCILFLGSGVFYISGFYPPYYNICYCFYLIFAFGANTF